ncbi:MAG: hypothetical protein WD638_01070 [Nitriliruptoraceae bacterium]
MLVRGLSLAGGVAYLVAGPLIGVAVSAGAGSLAGLAALVAWVGIGGLLAALLLVARANHRMLRRLGERTAAISSRLDHLDGRELVDVPTLTAQLEATTDVVREELAADRADARASIDHRVLGLHELVRQLARGATGSGSAASPRRWDVP